MSGPAGRIVVVDDNPATRYATSRVLRSEGLEVFEAATGAEALALADRHPDLVVLDVDLPDMHGFEVCRRLRLLPATARIPILHVSAVYIQDRDKVQGLESGADGYMTHPVEPPALLATVKAFLRARRAEDALRETEAKVMAILERSPSGIAVLSRGMVFLDVNPAVCRQFGRAAGDILGKHVSAFLPQQAEAAFLAAVESVEIDGAWTGTFPVIAADADGTVRQLEWRISTSPPDSRLAITTDITERLRADSERERLFASEREARAEAERANRIKDEFLAVLSHELRTPLNAIVGWSHVLRLEAAGVTEDARKAVGAIERNAQVQAQLISDLLDVSRIASGKLALDRQRLDLPSIVDAALSSLDSQAREKDVTIQRELPPAGLAVYWDQARLIQVVWNLVGNAIKFSSAGGVVRVAVREADSIVLEVSDTGRGISPEFLPHVFDRFRQEDASITRIQGGLGLGLSVVKHLVEAHGGCVAVDSAGERQGATFRVVFERETSGRAPGVTSTPVADPGLAGTAVLVVEDDADARGFVVRILRQLGMDVRESVDATGALESIEGDQPALVISDIGLRGGDGYALIRKIRAIGLTADTLPAIALTAYGGDDDRARALQAGYQKHLVKPVRPSDLEAAVATLLVQSRHRTAGRSRAANAP